MIGHTGDFWFGFATGGVIMTFVTAVLITRQR